ncbi:MAG: hypothetical protein P1V81_02340 [Planctomycetota bacterium]|nr:hypothetical protein [Planctomycetota bacterium]
MIQSSLRLGLLTLGLFFVVSPSTLAQGDTQDSGLAREEMWRAPTEEDWQRPVLVTFQRTWEDALAVSRETQKPILACVNMDGEIASEHYAGIRYRQPEVAALYEDYVNVVASVYRHTPRDYDEEGNRVLCPRFGSTTCGEHIAIEPLLYAQYFEEVRVAPRHVMIELDKAEVYDVYYAFDTASVFAQLRAGIAERDVETRDNPWSDLPLLDRVGSREIGDRTSVETAFKEGDSDLRRQLLERAVETAKQEDGPEHHDLYRLALFSGDTKMARLAWQGLGSAKSEGSIDLILEALRFDMPEGDRAALVGSLERIGAKSERARTLAQVHRSVGSRTSGDEVTWGQGAGAHEDVVERLEARAQYAALSGVSSGDPTLPAPAEDPSVGLELAQSYIELAMHPETEAQYRSLFAEDARRTATEARRKGADPARCNAVLALCASFFGERKLGQDMAVAALGDVDAETTIDSRVAWLDERAALELTVLFAEGRQLQIVAALRAKTDWPEAWMGQVDAAYSTAASHALASDLTFANHYDFLRYMGAFGRSNQVLDGSLARFPESALMHERLRKKLIRERRLDALDGLEGTYEAMVQAPGASSWTRWYAGYASRTAAEFHRKSGRREAALAAYDRAIAHFERSIEGPMEAPADAAGDGRLLDGVDPTFRDSTDHQVAVCLAGKARVSMELDQLAEATALLVDAIERRPDSTMTLDGLNLSASDTVRTLRQRLTDAELASELATLEATTSKLDPALLGFPAFEAPAGQRPQNAGGQGGGRRGNRSGGGQGGGL